MTQRLRREAGDMRELTEGPYLRLGSTSQQPLFEQVLVGAVGVRPNGVLGCNYRGKLVRHC